MGELLDELNQKEDLGLTTNACFSLFETGESREFLAVQLLKHWFILPYIRLQAVKYQPASGHEGIMLKFDSGGGVLVYMRGVLLEPVYWAFQQRAVSRCKSLDEYAWFDFEQSGQKATMPILSRLLVIEEKLFPDWQKIDTQAGADWKPVNANQDEKAK